MTPGRGHDALAEVQASIRRAAEAGEMDQRRAPMPEALEAYNAIEAVSFSIPAHKGGGAIDDVTRAIVGIEPYRADAPAHRASTTGPPATSCSPTPMSAATWNVGG